MPVSVVTDSTHYLPPALLGDGIHQVSLYVHEGDAQAREADLDTGAFYDRLRTATRVPTTSQPSIGDFAAVYRPLVEAGHDVVSVHLSGALSGTCESARQAAAEVLGGDGARRIEVVDSAAAAGALGLAVLGAAAAARAGGDVEAVAARARTAADRTRLWFAVETLEYLRRSGRLGAAQALIGGALKIKPILSLEDGVLAPIERVRTSTRAFERLVDFLRLCQADGDTAWVVQHIQAPEQAERMVERGRELFGCEPVFVSEIGPVIGAHAGPGLLGVAGVPPAVLA